jgi:hypothetical protein
MFSKRPKKVDSTIFATGGARNSFAQPNYY